MNHTEATELQAVERYILDELDSSQKEGFEEHFFTCAQCAEDVRAGAALTDNLKAVARDEASRPFDAADRAVERHGWLERFRRTFRGAALIPSIAALAFCAVTAVETASVIGLRSEIARYREPRAVPAFALRAAARGEEGVIDVPKDARSFTVYFDVTWKRQPGGYLCDVLDESKTRRAEVKVPGDERNDTVNLLLDSAHFKPGRYTVVVRNAASPSDELGRYEFTLNYK
ncbi:MAG: hypothetical protein M3Y07_09830 [Acidobacteriota bacterium]|nr:hypothetical protein [Acidobacteriota bacterium]